VDLYIHDYAGHVGQLEVARALAARGHRVLFAYCDQLATPRGELTPDAALGSLTIEPIDIGQAIIKKNYFKRQWQDVKYARALVRHLKEHKPHLVVSSNNPLIPQWALVRHCRRRGIPVVHWWTDVYSLAVRHGVGQKLGPPGRMIAWFYEKLEIHLLKRSRAVLAIAEQFRSIADRWGVKTPLTVIPVAAPTDRIMPGPKRNAWSQRHGIADTTNVMYCGTLANKHHPELLLELAKRLSKQSDTRVIVVAEGVGADWLRQQQETARLPNLLLLPFQSFEDYPYVLATADVQVALLNREASAYALPSKVMSQLCAARAQAAIVPRDNQAATLVERAEAGIVYTPEEFDAAFAAIEKLLADAELRRRYGENGRRYAEERLSLESVTAKYEELFTQVIGKTARPALEMRRRRPEDELGSPYLLFQSEHYFILKQI
jgi:colanic acid biosynthesis glycosyl transferase WcaI